MSMILGFLVLLVVCGILATNVAAKINVHLVPHTHNDPGWLKTADQYYYGANNTIKSAGVQYILDNVITELLANEKRRFVYVEMSFFQRWYFEQTNAMRTLVKKLVANGQLSFANGGWVMHDEASTHYASMIDQSTLGHRFLVDEFGYTPTVGWQIDPFGHSNTHAWMSSEMGFDGLYFARIDYQDKLKRTNEKTLEFIWRGSRSLPASEVFTGVFTTGNLYGPPDGFCFDDACFALSEADPIMDDPHLENNNVDDVVSRFINAILVEQSQSIGSNIMLKMGFDFHYQNARIWFKNLDKLITYVNAADDRFNVTYSSPDEYTRARAAESSVTWTETVDDFFPYADCAHCYWGGYFTSRPTLKYIERMSASYLQVLKQWSALHLNSREENRPKLGSALADDLRGVLLELSANVGLLNHHDALTGTSKQHVAYDYFKKIDHALSRAEVLGAKLMALVVAEEAKADKLLNAELKPVLGICRFSNESVCTISESAKAGDDIFVVAYNGLARSVSSQVTVFLSSEYVEETDIVVKALGSHSLGRSSKKNIRRIDAQLFRSANTSDHAAAPWTLVFSAQNIPPLGIAKFIVSSRKRSTDSNLAPVHTVKSVPVEPKQANQDTQFLVVQNDKIALRFNHMTGLLAHVRRLDGNDKSALECDIHQDIKYYASFGSSVVDRESNDEIEKFKSLKSPFGIDLDRDPSVMNLFPDENLKGSVSPQVSGAYIFRPANGFRNPVSIRNNSDPASVVSLTVVEGPLVTEIRQNFSNYASQIIRIRRNSVLVEFQWVIGPLPIKGNFGKEVISSFASNLDSKQVFYTDSNGREFMKRQTNWRPTYELEVNEPVSGNYYPVSTSAYLQDTSRGLQLSIITDRGQGAASLRSGELEFMVHRRLQVDDWRGVFEALDETTDGTGPGTKWPLPKRLGDGITVSGTHYLLLSSIDSGMAELRQHLDEVYQSPKLFFGTATIDSDLLSEATENAMPVIPESSALYELPVNVQLLTLEYWSPGILLVRLAHQFAVEEDSVFSAEVTVDLQALLPQFEVISLAEMTLTANQLRSEMEAKKIRWTTSSKKVAHSDQRVPPLESSTSTSFAVALAPMQIRTFLVKVQN